MRKKTNTSSNSRVWAVLIPGLFITLYINPLLNDPFNTPKQWILIIAGSWLIGHIITQTKFSKSSVKKINLFEIIIIGFLFSMLVSTLFTDIKYNAFIGETYRRLGFLTYLFLSIFMYAAYRFFNLASLPKLYKTIFIAGVVTAGYSSLQKTGNDFIKWNNPYNSIIATFGNPNFASAGMSVFAVLCFSTIFISSFSKIYKLVNITLVVWLFYLIYSSDSRQGIVSFFAGISILFIIYFYSIKKSLGIISLLLTSTIGLISIFGMLQSGPLEKYLYKPSVSIRGFYWRAGIEMLKNFPLTGVGIDRYGAYFKEFREQKYTQNYGFDITSSNAHSIPIQLFATGGIFVGTFYLLLIIFIINRGIRSITKLEGNKRFLYAGVFAAWISFQAQSIISIENIALGIWGWILGGIVVGISTTATSEFGEKLQVNSGEIKKQNNLTLLQPVISSIFTLFAVLFVSMLYVGENSTIKAKTFYNPNNKSQSTIYSEAISKVLQNKIIDPNYKYMVIQDLYETDQANEAIKQIKILINSDPINLDYLRGGAFTSEGLGDYATAIELRKRISNLDPWNSDNYLRLGMDYKIIGDISNMRLMLNRIIEVSPNHPIVKTAILELVS